MFKEKYKPVWMIIRNRIVAGLFVVVPMVISLWIAYFIYTKLTEWSVGLIQSIFRAFAEKNFFGAGFLAYLGSHVHDFWFISLVRIAALIIICALLLGIGQLAKYALGRRLIAITEWLMMKVPMLNTVYSTTRQIGDAIWAPGGGMFRQVVLFEYPRKGIYVIGFVTNENKGPWEIGAKTGKDLVNVFLPTTPNPTGGFLLFIPREDCIFLDMDVAVGMRLVISGGAVTSVVMNNLPNANKLDPNPT